ncbi:1,4-dihydroxy-2-naphthoate polyprenyltransferase [Lacticaseibacillus brantae]|uniref:Prenyltransferase, UbiA family n=1 Tax=Lacticaseibacillus brantae DSM 23927 TaxID=1423727 RepID=A0A0R2AVM9_9LACO|nr:1,4-dihydroxy-2-naphthoate polyprenyltransferase [Lacticaseibacillus brantae]KRM71486.1 prenyltransferase, UbiA family [Lacticaseibacillus brantae DSM 23927]
MGVKVFLEVVEARTKLASILPFVVGTLFAAVYFGQVNWVNTGIFFIAMLFFDMATTALNNLMDFQKAKDNAYRHTTNIIGRAQVSPALVAIMVVTMVAIATVLGLVLVWRTNWLLLLIGMVCFAIGIFYTFGPLPLSRLPLGEVLSGGVMGLGIPFIAVYINVPENTLLALQLAWPQFGLTGNFVALIALGLTCIPAMATIANVMLANNISDCDEDLRNHRTTLPMYLGKKYSLWLYIGLAYVGYIGILAAVIMQLLPWPALLIVVSLPWVMANTRRFAAKQVKHETFGTSVANLVLENGSLILGLLLAWGVKG